MVYKFICHDWNYPYNGKTEVIFVTVQELVYCDTNNAIIQDISYCEHYIHICNFLWIGNKGLKLKEYIVQMVIKIAKILDVPDDFSVA